MKLSNSNISFITFASTERWGLGNEMFALASTFGINQRANKFWKICFSRNAKIRSVFQLDMFLDCEKNELMDLNADLYTEKSYAVYDDSVNNIPSSNHIILNKFFQSWKYFENCKEEILKLFNFKRQILNSANDSIFYKYNQWINNKKFNFNDNKKLTDKSTWIKVAIHVRREAISDHIDLIDIGYVTADLNYIQRSIKYMKQHLSPKIPIFFIFSDDIRWCEKEMSEIKANIIYMDLENNPALDLAGLTLCDHHIITVGTFGWWGAWIANGTTIYFKNWPRKGSYLYEQTNLNDYFPKHWIAL